VASDPEYNHWVEAALGWYYYLENQLRFPFEAPDASLPGSFHRYLAGSFRAPTPRLAQQAQRLGGISIALKAHYRTVFAVYDLGTRKLRLMPASPSALALTCPSPGRLSQGRIYHPRGDASMFRLSRLERIPSSLSVGIGPAFLVESFPAFHDGGQTCPASCT